MAWIAALAGTAASAIGASKAQSSQNEAIGQNKALADRLFYMGMPAYGKKAKQGLWSMIDPMLQQYLGGYKPQIISPELESEQYNLMKRPMEEAYTEGRGSLEQGMVNRGLEYGNVLPTALGKYDTKYQEALGDLGTKIKTQAAQLNYGAEQDYTNRIMQTLMSLFRQGEAVRQGREGQSVQIQSDANAAGGLAGSNYWSSLAGGFGNLMGSLPWQQWFQPKTATA